MMASGLLNDTQLTWDANKEPDIAGYEIVWRDTTETVWTHSRAVGNVKTYTMKGMSKDNYFFGVRAVDKEGNRSPVTSPKPQPAAHWNRRDARNASLITTCRGMIERRFTQPTASD